MPNIDETAKAWQADLAARAGRAVKAAREDRGWTAAKLSDRTRELGYPLHRIAISKIETGNRSGKLDVAELAILALALGVPPVQLLYPELPDGEVEVWPGITATNIQALQWFSGDSAGASHIAPGPNANVTTTERLSRSRELDAMRRLNRRREIDRLEAQLTGETSDVHEPFANLESSIREKITELTREFRADGWPVEDA